MSFTIYKIIPISLLNLVETASIDFKLILLDVKKKARFLIICFYTFSGEPHDREDVDAEGLPSVGQDHRAAEVGRPYPDHRPRRRHVHDERQRISGLNSHAKDDGLQRGRTRTEVTIKLICQ